MMLKQPFNESLTYSKNADLSQTSQFGPLKSSVKGGIQPYNRSPEHLNKISERKDEIGSSHRSQRDDIESLRMENEKLKQNLNAMIDQKKGVSFSNHEKSSIYYYNKSSPSVVNPYNRNLYNSA